MRIIAGSLRGRRVQGPDPGDNRIRPTSDRAREALFSILLKWPSGPFLDLCGGTGAVALEAYSRGYHPVGCVERDPEAFMLLGRNMRGTPLVAMHKDIRRLKPDSFPPQAVIFADPPYEQSRELWLELGPKLQPWLRNDGVLVWETDGTTELIACQGWHLADVRKYGAARFHFFEPTGR